ncbi:hypothetical protein [Neorhizobium sp. DAR64872/K0K18]|uniref:hypothetical protein n=1 Tax=Neorhizobium sp. DAR64872/K0K18 TaxID=3421958 RepID=UPI003D2C1A6B
MQLYPVAGAKFYVGPAVNLVPDDTDITVANFATDTYLEVKGWQTMGSFGDTSALITEQVISQQRDVKGKGTRNAGSMANNFLVLPTDAGQLAMIAAAQTDYNYKFKLLMDDAAPALLSVVTMTIATPGVISWANHGLVAGTPVKFSTTGALPTGLTAGTTYYVVNPTTSAFSVAATPGGSAIATSGTQSGVHTAITAPTGTIKYFYGIVMSSNEQGGGANTSRVMACVTEINSAIITVPAVG